MHARGARRTLAAMGSHALFLHAADAMSHAATWYMAACAAAGAALGIVLSSGGGLARRALRRPTAAAFELRAWGVRDGTWWAEVERTATRRHALPVDGWRLVTDAGEPRIPAVEPMANNASRHRFGLVAATGGARPLRLEWRTNGRVTWSVDLVEAVAQHAA